MKGETAERWRTLCQQVQTEQDPNKLMEIIHEINRLLKEKAQRLRNQEPKDQQSDKTIEAADKLIRALDAESNEHMEQISAEDKLGRSRNS